MLRKVTYFEIVQFTQLRSYLQTFSGEMFSYSLKLAKAKKLLAFCEFASGNFEALLCSNNSHSPDQVPVQSMRINHAFCNKVPIQYDDIQN